MSIVHTRILTAAANCENCFVLAGPPRPIFSLRWHTGRRTHGGKDIVLLQVCNRVVITERHFAVRDCTGRTGRQACARVRGELAAHLDRHDFIVIAMNDGKVELLIVKVAHKRNIENTIYDEL